MSAERLPIAAIAGLGLTQNIGFLQPSRTVHGAGLLRLKRMDFRSAVSCPVSRGLSGSLVRQMD